MKCNGKKIYIYEIYYIKFFYTFIFDLYVISDYNEN